ncbi:MAG TPA: hypothetical protein VG387_17755 [Rhizomicrobium sp.]|jgi:hypothetical protein|nr:hypothetical protein [Rhizomicrobium sp.]
MKIAGALAAGLAACMAAAIAAPAGWSVQDFPARGFSVAVPAGWSADPGYHDRGYGYYQGYPEDQIAGVRIDAPDGLQPETNLRSDESYLLVERLERAPGACKAGDFIVDPPADFQIFDERHDGDHALLTSGDPGGMAVYEDSVSVLAHVPCIAVHEVIAFAPADGFGKGETPFDHARMKAAMDAIRATVVVHPVE